jgi:aminomethyltransferase
VFGLPPFFLLLTLIFGISFMGKQTSLYQRHVDANAKIVDFGGWDMPLHYGSQIDEHHVVRNKAGMFDVSHMTVVDVTGADSKAWLRQLLANDVERLKNPGKGLYSCMLNDAGGVIDDLIVYWQGDDNYRVVVNAATREADLDWMQQSLGSFDVALNERAELAMIAVQGPAACSMAAPYLPSGVGEAALALRAFESLEASEVFVARTGYTGEDGWEILLNPAAANTLWDELCGAGIQPCGLGARDTLRLESGLNLYGQDMTTITTPLVSNLTWTVAWQPAERDFTGRSALELEQQQGVATQLVGLVLEGRGVMRAGIRVSTAQGDGQVTSGGFSPTMQRSIALARVPTGVTEGCEVEIRNKLLPAKIVKPPFVRNGVVKIDV